MGVTEFGEPILHVDMDAFFVEVERLGDPRLRGAPVVVGGLGNRGVVAAASYEARVHGVHSAMPMVHARRLCPGGIFLPPDHRRYGDVSAQVFELLRSFTPSVEAMSIDEAFLDVSGLRFHYPDAAAVAAAIRSRIRNDLELPASVGVAATKMLAKMASEAAKPDGMLVVAAGTELEFLHPSPVRALWGVGEATYAALEALGVETIGDLALLPEGLVRRRLGETVGRHLFELAWGRDPRPVTPHTPAKSVSVEATYETDLVDPDELDDRLFRHSERLARRLRSSEVAARTITLKIRFADFSTFTRSLTLDTPVDETHDVAAAARALLKRVTLRGRRVRLLGIGGSGLTPAAEPRQLDFAGPRRRKLTEASDDVRRRFGADAVIPARLAESEQVTRPQSTSGGGGRGKSA